MADFAYGFRQNTNYVITSNTMYEIGRNYRVNNSIPCQTSNTANYWTQVTNGYQYTIAIQSPGTLWVWGNNAYGQLGLNTSSTNSVSSPVQVGALNYWTQISAGYISTCGIQSPGTLWAWGNNAFGQLGTSNTTNYSSPIQVGLLSNWTSISSGIYFTLATQNNGTLWSWGYNNFGQLGLNDTTNRSSPVQVGALSNWSQVACGKYYTLATQSNGTLWAWGNNSNGQLGLNTLINYSSPVQLAATAAVSTISAFSLQSSTAGAIHNDGTLWMWGSNLYYQLGQSNITNRSSPVQVGSVSNWSKLSGSGYGSYGDYFSLALQSPGTLWAWGYNAHGELGQNNTVSPNSSPVQIGALNSWSQVAKGAWHWVGVQNNGTLWACGYNGKGALSTGNTSNKSSPIQIGALTTWSSVVASDVGMTGALKTDGTWWVCGYNLRGALGINTTTTIVTSMVQVGTASNWSQVGFGYYTTGAIKSNNTLWMCGYNLNGQLGNNTSGAATTVLSPVQIGALSVWTQVACGYNHSAAVQNNGTLWSWGNNSKGQLGLNTTVGVSNPTQVGNLSIWVSVACGYFSTIAKDNTGQLWSWGNNSLGQFGVLGLNTLTSYSSPVQIPAATAGITTSYWAKISCGYDQSVAIQSNGTLWAWGLNSYGQLGLNTTTGYSSPLQIGTLSIWTSIASGSGFTAALQSPGTVWAWGLNSQGQLGINTLTNYSSPVQVGTQSIWTQLVTNNSSPIMAGIQSPGTLWTWGANVNFALGYNSTSYRSYPQQLGASNAWTGFPTGSQNNIWGAAINSNNNLYVWGVNSNRILNSAYYNNDNAGVTIDGAAVIVTPVPLDPTLSTPIKSVSMGDQFGVYVQSNGTLWSWGNVSYGQVPVNFGFIPAPTYMSGWSTFATGGPSTGAIRNGTLWTWGDDTFGGLGLNTTTSFSSPQQVGALSTWTSVSVGWAGATHMIALQSNGTLWGWGFNTSGQLGLSDAANRSSPVQVGALSVWSRVVCGNQMSAAIQSNGTLWTWGQNNYGQLGLSDTTSRSSPAQVGALSVWAQVSCGYYFTSAIQSNGTLWSWGNNSFGQLGINTSTLSALSSPVQVGSLSLWTKIATGWFSALGIQSNGTLWAWGGNSFGQLGLNTSTNYSSPVQVGTLSNWIRIASGNSMTLALQSNGTLWTAGSNSQGQLGLNTAGANSFSSLVQIGILSNWTNVVAGTLQSAALQSNNVLSLWGYNSGGQVGYGAIVGPIPISNLSNWSQVCCGLNYAMAVQNTGVLYAWGNNSYGQLGTGDLTHRSSLTQVGTTSNWSRVACGYSHTAALQSNGTLWAWGVNSYGQLGQGNFTNTSTPVQVGTISRYVTVYAMNYTTLAETQ